MRVFRRITGVARTDKIRKRRIGASVNEDLRASLSIKIQQSSLWRPTKFRDGKQKETKKIDTHMER